jgi:pimeloyl-ACP methyl ester carboxylesterase
MLLLAPAGVAHAQPAPPEPTPGVPDWRAQRLPDFDSLAPLACDPDGTQASGAVYRICMPANWTGDLLVYAHGYVSPLQPVGIPEGQLGLPGGPSLPDIANAFGFAFATTSYRDNGLVVLPALDDLVDLVRIFGETKGKPARVLLVGVSEGGLIATLAIERFPDVFDGGLALCGPYGSMAGQIDYFGDFRVVFDYFFPGLLPGTAVEIPPSLLSTWETSYYTDTVRPVLVDPANAGKVDQLLAVAHAPWNADDPATRLASAADLLWYNVFATNDGTSKLGGQPFDNHARSYSGSSDDAALNQTVPRFTPVAVARTEIAAHYETSGRLRRPLVTVHTTGDPIVPYWHATRYAAKTLNADNQAFHRHLRVDRYGHCNFTQIEMLGAFNTLRQMVNNPPPYDPVNRSYLPLLAATTVAPAP